MEPIKEEKKKTELTEEEAEKVSGGKLLPGCSDCPIRTSCNGTVCLCR